MKELAKLEVTLRAKTEKFVRDVRSALQQTVGRITGIPIPGGGMGALGIAAGATAAVIAILSKINDNIKNMLKELERASPAFKGTQDLIKKIFNRVLMPFGNILTTIMRPYYILMLRVLRKGMEKIRPIIKRLRAGEITPEEAIGEMEKIWKDMLTGLYQLNQMMLDVIKPIAGKLDGFIKGLEIATSSFLSGITDWFGGFLDGLRAGLSPMPDILAEEILADIMANPEAFFKLPKNVRDKFFNWIENNPGELDKLPANVREEFDKWIIDESEKYLKDIGKETSTAMLDTIVEGLTPLSKLGTWVYNLIREEIRKSFGGAGGALGAQAYSFGYFTPTGYVSVSRTRTGISTPEEARQREIELGMRRTG